jgi:hypothetical protein
MIIREVAKPLGNCVERLEPLSITNS